MAGVRFWGYEAGGSLVGVMGIQRVRDVELIRHAYVLPGSQGHGVGGALLEHLQGFGTRRMLVGTWAAAEWAIRFYRRHGFQLVAPERTACGAGLGRSPTDRSRRRLCWRTRRSPKIESAGRSARRDRRGCSICSISRIARAACSRDTGGAMRATLGRCVLGESQRAAGVPRRVPLSQRERRLGPRGLSASKGAAGIRADKD